MGKHVNVYSKFEDFYCTCHGITQLQARKTKLKKLWKPRKCCWYQYRYQNFEIAVSWRVMLLRYSSILGPSAVPPVKEFLALQHSLPVQSRRPRKAHFPSFAWPWRLRQKDPSKLRLLHTRRHELASTGNESSPTSMWELRVRNGNSYRFLNIEFKIPCE